MGERPEPRRPPRPRTEFPAHPPGTSGRRDARQPGPRPSGGRPNYAARRLGALVLVLALVGGIAAALTAVLDRGKPSGDRAAKASQTSDEVGSASSAGIDTDTDTACDGAATVHAWPLRQRLAQLVMLGVPASDPIAVEAAAEAGVGGVFLVRRGTAALTTGVLRNLSSPQGIPLVVAIDDEGGRVQALGELAGDLPSARSMAALDPEEIRSRAQVRGTAMAEAGVTVDLAPVLDVSAQADNEVIGDRSWGDNPTSVIRGAGAFAAGLEDAGITPALKHFPGHGRADGDSHRQVVSTPPLAELEAVDLVAYRRLLTEDRWVLVGHLDVPGLTQGEPASLSPAAIGALLRETLGFDGVVVSDELGGMAAVSSRYPLPEAVRRFLAAGGDLALWNGADRLVEVLDSLEAAVATGSLPEERVDESVARVLRAKEVDVCDGSA